MTTLDESHVPPGLEDAEALFEEARRRRRHRRWWFGVVVAAVVLTMVVVVAEHGGSGKPPAAGLHSAEGHGAAAIKNARSNTATTPARGYRLLSYHGVHVEVPASWPVDSGMLTLFCGEPFPATPTAFVGPQLNPESSGCAFDDEPPPTRYGVWLQTWARPTGAASLRTHGGGVVLGTGPGGSATTSSYWYHGVSIEIGLGPNPKVAQAIFNSIGFTAHRSDTKVSVFCAMSATSSAMPTPQRLKTTIVLRDVNETLSPSPPSALPLIPAAEVWEQAIPEVKEPYELPRLFLALYSEKFPPLSNTTSTGSPFYRRNILAWVVYAVSRSPSITGCGGPADDVVDADSGQSLGSFFTG